MFAIVREMRWSWLIALAATLGATAPAEAQVRGEAFLGTPFGVGRVVLPLSPGEAPAVLGPAGVKLSETGGRVLYPVAADRPVLGILRGALARPQMADVYFLFEGEAPLELTIETQSVQKAVIAPRLNPALYDALLAEWWRQYAPLPRLLRPQPDYSPMVDSYLRSMLAPRLGLEIPRHPTDQSWQAQMNNELGLATGTETVRIAIQQERMRRHAAFTETTDQPLPEPADPEDLPPEAIPLPPPVDVAELPSETSLPPEPSLELEPSLEPEPSPNAEPEPDVAIDSIAMHVPAECFYARFGSYSNFLWVQDTLKQWGGDAQNLIAMRGVDFDLGGKIERQLVLRETALARLLGDTVIADVALVGTDYFIKEGGAYGMLFHARKGSDFLANSIRQQRTERVDKKDGVTDETVTLAGRDVSYLSTPDGSVRSYYAADGDFHFVTTSKTLATRFIEIGAGEGSLGATREFENARILMPQSRRDTVFVYLSDVFLRNLLSPAYRVEMVRRVQALADVELVEMARLAAAAEDKPSETIDQLIRGGFLPGDFGARPDGSRTVLADGEVYDSLRGRRGNFVPIPDMPVDRVTPSEAESHRRFVDFYHTKWGRLDPTIIAMKRHSMAGGRERIVVDAQLSPMAMRHYDILKRYAGEPDQLRLAPVAGDMAAFELITPDERMFAGVQDFRPPLEMLPGGGMTLVGRLRDTLVGYTGSTRDGNVLLRLLDPRLANLAGAVGLVPGNIGLFQAPWNGFVVSSFQPDVLAGVLPQLRFEQAERPAQFRLRVEDLSAGRFSRMVNNLAYARTRQTSLSNIRLMESFNQQLHVPGPDCKEAVERLLGVKFICPLGGTYEYRQTPGGVGYWTSTALAQGQPGGLFLARAPEGYEAPPMNWFRGLDMDALLLPHTLVAHAEVMMQKPGAK